MVSDGEDELQYQIDSDMLGSQHSEDQNEVYMNDSSDHEGNEVADNSEFYANDNSDSQEDDSLRRLSNQARGRRVFDHSFGEFEFEDEDEDEVQDEAENEDIEMDTADFLRRFIQSRARQNTRLGNVEEEGEEEEEEDEEEEGEENGEEEEEEEGEDNGEGDSHSDFFRAIGSLASGMQDTTGRGQGFADVMQRLMGGGIVFNERENREMQSLIDNLNQREDTYLILETLNELSEKLLMMNGITAERTIPSNKLAKSLVHIMEDPILAEDLELHLVACRCLYNFIEVNQDFIHDALNNNAVEVLCNALMEISYIDLTEQALQTLEMISRDPVSHNIIVKSNGLQACLQYLDFLTSHAQRKCLTIVANSCTNVQVSNFHLVNEVFDNISNVVRNYTDPLVVENGWLAISRVISSFKSKPNFLEDLFGNKEELLKEMTEAIFISCNKSSMNEETSKTPLNYSSCLSLIKSLSIIASVSVSISEILLKYCRIGKVLLNSLNKYSKPKDSEEITEKISISIEALMATPKELLLQFLILINHLLPFPSPEGNIDSDKIFSQSLQLKIEVNLKRIASYKNNEDSYRLFIGDIWLLLINSFQATMDLEIRQKVLLNLRKIVAFSNEEDFRQIEGYYLITGLLASISNLSKLARRNLNGAHKLEKNMFEEIDSNMSQILRDDGKQEQNSYIMETEPKSLTYHNGLESDANIIDKNEIGLEKLSDESNDEIVYNDFDFSDSSNNKANILLLFSIAITRDLIIKMPDLIRVYFEREGLLNDCITIVDNLVELASKNENEKTSYYLNTANFTLDFDLVENYIFSISSEKIYAHIIVIGKQIKETYMSVTSRDPVDLPDHMKLLLEIKKEITKYDMIETYSFKEWREIWKKLRFALLGGPEKVNISSFELISSGIIQSIAYIFSSDNFDFGFEFNDCYKAFISEFFVDGSKDDSVLLFVNKLQDALTRSESFDIISTNNSQFLYNNESSATASMARQVKMKLTFDNSCGNTIPQNMQNMILSVHAIATFKSIDTFLRQRFKVLEELSGYSNEEESETEEEITLSQSGIEAKPRTRIEFLINGDVIPNETTIYGAIYRSLQTKPDEIINPSRIWSSTHSVSFRKVEYVASKDSIPISYNSSTKDNELEVYDEITISILNLLKTLFEMNSFVKNNITSGVFISTDSFTNWKLAVKLNRQLEELLVVASGTLPGWSIHVTKKFPFIFPFNSRVFFLQSTSFGYSRLIHHWQIRTNQETDNNSTINQRPQLGRPTRHKVRLSRKLILQSAIKVISMYGSTPGILEIEYFEEVGSGLGPTLEFYSMVSKEFSKKKLKLWRSEHSIDENEDDYVDSSTGLFPIPMDKHNLSSENGKKILQLFASLGKFIARAMIDSRIIDFNFNLMFIMMIQLLNSNKRSLKDVKKIANISCLRIVDPHLASSVEHLLKYLKEFPNFNENERNKITVDGATLEQLSLTFTLPGYPEYELIPHGDEVMVDASNVELYINKVLDATLYSGIINQTNAFMEGFSKVFPVESLTIFSPEEVLNLWGSAEEDWSIDTLTSCIHANHGYTKESDIVKGLVNVLASFGNSERRLFLQFLTGAPRLPIGGFKALKPEFTVVRKQPESGMKDDDYLPSVMTCANYLKLPNYSSEVVMRRRLLQAMNDGAGAFLLS